jgi:hypothetical protein
MRKRKKRTLPSDKKKDQLSKRKKIINTYAPNYIKQICPERRDSNTTV